MEGGREREEGWREGEREGGGFENFSVLTYMYMYLTWAHTSGRPALKNGLYSSELMHFVPNHRLVPRLSCAFHLLLESMIFFSRDLTY